MNFKLFFKKEAHFLKLSSMAIKVLGKWKGKTSKKHLINKY